MHADVQRDEKTAMSLPTPTSTNSPFNPDNNTAMDLSSGSGKNTDEKNSAEQKSPEMKQDRSADTSNNGAEDVWQQLEGPTAQEGCRSDYHIRPERHSKQRTSLPNTNPSASPGKSLDSEQLYQCQRELKKC
jgi:hypothetical protein